MPEGELCILAGLEVCVPVGVDEIGEGGGVAEEGRQGPVRESGGELFEEDGQEGRGQGAEAGVEAAEPVNETGRLGEAKLKDVLEKVFGGGVGAEAGGRRRRYGEAGALGRGEGLEERVGEVGVKGVEGEGDVVAGLPKVVGELVEGAAGDDDARRVGLAETVTEMDGVGFVEKGEAAFRQGGEDGFVGEQAIRVADEGEGVGGRGEGAEDSGEHGGWGADESG